MVTGDAGHDHVLEILFKALDVSDQLVRPVNNGFHGRVLVGLGQLLVNVTRDHVSTKDADKSVRLVEGTLSFTDRLIKHLVEAAASNFTVIPVETIHLIAVDRLIKMSV